MPETCIINRVEVWVRAACAALAADNNSIVPAVIIADQMLQASDLRWKYNIETGRYEERQKK